MDTVPFFPFIVSSDSSLLILYFLSNSSLCSSLAHVPSPPYFTPSCSNPNKIGTHCNISSLPCDILTPCLNNATCINSNATATADGYTCLCPSSFEGAQCQIDNRPCKPETCRNDGTLSLFFNETYVFDVFVLFLRYMQ